MIASSSYLGEVELWNSNGMKLSTVASYQKPAFNVSFSPDSQRLLVSGASSFNIYSIGSNGQVENVSFLSCDDSFIHVN